MFLALPNLRDISVIEELNINSLTESFAEIPAATIFATLQVILVIA